MHWLLTALTLFLVLALSSPAQSQDCPLVAESIGDMERAGFEGAYREGWYFGYERYANGCQESMANALASFRERHASELRAPELSAYRYRLFWNEGHHAAQIGQYDRAAALFRQAQSEPRREYDAAFYDVYIAFFTRDRGGAQRARDALASQFDARPLSELQGQSASWQLAKLDGLLACFDRPYSEADTTCARQFMH